MMMIDRKSVAMIRRNRTVRIEVLGVFLQSMWYSQI